MGSAYHSIRFWAYARSYEKSPAIQGRQHETSETEEVRIFENPLIFDKVLDCLDKKGLLHARLVCSAWNKEICRRLERRSTYLKFHTEDEFQTLRDYVTNFDGGVDSAPGIQKKKTNRLFSFFQKKDEGLAKFNIRSFYFKLIPYYFSLPSTLRMPSISAGIVRLKVAVHSTDLHNVLSTLQYLHNLEELYIIKLPQFHFEFDDFQSIINRHQLFEPLFPQGLKIPSLKSLRIRNFACSKSIRCATNGMLLPKIVTLISSAPKLEHLEVTGWSGKIASMIGVTRLNYRLRSLRLRNQSVGYEEMRILTKLEFPKIELMEIKLHISVGNTAMESFYAHFGHCGNLRIEC